MMDCIHEVIQEITGFICFFFNDFQLIYKIRA